MAELNRVRSQVVTRVLLTGSTGFVGRVLCDELAHRGYVVRTAVRSHRAPPASASERVTIDDIGRDTRWERALKSVDVIMHVAARAHVLNDELANADLYFETNARGTHSLAEAAARSGVRQFIFLSSIKVNGERTLDRPFRASDPPDPQDAYGSSKWLGERLLTEVSGRTGLHATIVRAPLVYGAGVRANFLRLLRWIDRGWPLPLGAVANRRSLISVWNLADFLGHVVEKCESFDGTWIVSDGMDLSTPELLRRIGVAMGRRVRLISVPEPALRLIGSIAGRREEIARLCGSLVADTSETRSILRWDPPLDVDRALERTVEWYENEKRLGKQ